MCTCACVLVCVWACSHEFVCLQKPEEGIESLGVIGSYGRHLMWVVEIKLRASARVVHLSHLSSLKVLNKHCFKINEFFKQHYMACSHIIALTCFSSLHMWQAGSFPGHYTLKPIKWFFSLSLLSLDIHQHKLFLV